MLLITLMQRNLVKSKDILNTASFISVFTTNTQGLVFVQFVLHGGLTRGE